MSGLQPYPEYKDSGVEWLGETPAHWGLHALKRSVVGCVNGIWGEEPSGQDDLVVLRVADFDRTGLKVSNEKLTYRYITPKESEQRLLKSGDLLIEKSGGGEKTLVGCVVLFEHEYAAVTSNFVAKMSPRSGFDGRYLTYAFNHLYDRKVNLMSIKQTTGIQNIDSDSYLSNYFCFPDLAEQQLIAGFLDRETARIDNLIAEKQNFINLLKEKRQALISQVVTKGLDPQVKMKDSGIEWIGEVPVSFELVPFTKCVSETSDYRGKTPDKTDFGVFLVTAKNIKMGFIDYESSQEYISEDDYEEVMRRGRPAMGDLLFTTEAPLGNVALVDDPTIALAQRVIRFRMKPQLMMPRFSLYCVLSQFFQTQINRLATGITAKGIKASKLNQLKVFRPPIEEQQKIVQYLEEQDERNGRLITEVENSISLLREHRTALISAAVTGKIDVRNH